MFTIAGGVILGGLGLAFIFAALTDDALGEWVFDTIRLAVGLVLMAVVAYALFLTYSWWGI